jgi:hypothetical protein
MYSIMQQLFVMLVTATFNFGKRQIQKRRVAHMSPEKRQQWREQELDKLHARAVRRVSRMRDEELLKRGLTRADCIRRLEFVMIGDRGRIMPQCLLDGMDLRGLDLSTVKRGGICQEHIERALGDRYTKLPVGLKAPEAWASA